jgi:hypothetical protein
VPPYSVVRCSECDLVYVDPIPDAIALSRHYDQDYYAEWISAQRDKRERMWARRLKGIESMASKGRILAERVAGLWHRCIRLCHRVCFHETRAEPVLR